jgi:membrane protease YdiL (CAAX protease family)
MDANPPAARHAPDSVTRFFALTFLMTWGLQVPGVLAKSGILPGHPRAYLPLAALGIFGPFAAAALLTARAGGAVALHALFAPLVRWRTPLRVYLVALAPALLLSAGLGLLRGTRRDGAIAYMPNLAGVIAAVVISLAEEVGWRGFALPRLQRQLGSFSASAVIGVLWLLWHFPMFIGTGVPLSLLPVMLLYFVGGSLVFTWLFNGSSGSLFVSVFAHVCVHLNNSMRALPSDSVPYLVHAIVYGGLGLTLTAPALIASERMRQKARFLTMAFRGRSPFR